MTLDAPIRLSARRFPKGGPPRTPPLLEHAMPDGVLRGRRLVIFVHGFNNSASDAAESWRIAEDRLRGMLLLPERRSLLVEYYWPGDPAWECRQLPASDYAAAVAVATRCGRDLGEFLVRVRPRSVAFVAHSLGSHVALEALDALRPAGVTCCDGMLLMAAAVPEGLCEAGKHFQRAAVVPAEIHVALHSSHDWVLRVAFPWGQRSAERRGLAECPSPGSHRAVGRRGGPRARWSPSGRATALSLGHGDYWVDRAALRHVADLMGAVAEWSPAAWAPETWSTLGGWA